MRRPSMHRYVPLLLCVAIAALVAFLNTERQASR
jgi:hypothetical protein